MPHIDDVLKAIRPRHVVIAGLITLVLYSFYVFEVKAPLQRAEKQIKENCSAALGFDEALRKIEAGEQFVDRFSEVMHHCPAAYR